MSWSNKIGHNSRNQVPLQAEEHARFQWQIEMCTYELWQQSGCKHGDLEDWLKA